MNRFDKIQSMLDQNPADEFLLYAMAQEHQKADQYDQAIEWYHKLEKANPEYVGLYYHLAHCLVQTGALSEAMSTYDNGISIAEKINDLHALSELKNARMNLELGID